MIGSRALDPRAPRVGTLLLRQALLAGVTLLAACEGGGMHPCVAWQTHELARCSTVIVPENRTAVGGRSIALHVMVLPGHMAPHDADPVFALNGGPGAAGSDLAGWATDALGELRTSRDLVLVDVRGTGRSAPLDCDLYDAGGRMQPFVDPMFPLDRVRRCADRLSVGANLAQYTTSIIADDLNDVRRALGYRQINLLGASYGSRLALVYMRRHAASVRSAVLVGISPPEAPVLRTSPGATDRALTRAFVECARDAECHRGAPDPRADVASLLATLRAAPATVRLWNWRRLSFERVTLTARGVAERLWAATYSPAGIVRELPFVHRAARGDYAELTRRLAREGRQRRTGRSDGMMLSVLCAEDAPRLDGADTSSTLLGAPVVAELLRACAAWPRGAVPSEFATPVHSDIPTLLLSGALDPVTPPELADSAQRWLTKARSYVDPLGGHAGVDERGQAMIVELIRRPLSPPSRIRMARVRPPA